MTPLRALILSIPRGNAPHGAQPTSRHLRRRAISVNIFTIIGNAIWAKVEPLLNKHLTGIRADAKDEVAQLREDVMAEVAAWRVDSMEMLSKALPEMAGEVAEHAIGAVFKHTQADEAVNAASGIVTSIVERLQRRIDAIPFPALGR